MRTAILFGLTLIAGAINVDPIREIWPLVCVILAIVSAMDAWSLLKK